MRSRWKLVVMLLVACSSLGTAARAQERLELTAPDPRGDLLLTVLGGLGGAAVATGVVVGAYHFTVSCRDAAGDCVTPRIAYAFLPAMMAAPILMSTGVVLAANATGGNGYFMATALGLLGLGPGIAVLMTNTEGHAPAVDALGIGLMAAGYITGAIIGYRWSASDTPRASVVLTPTTGGAALVLTGAL